MKKKNILMALLSGTLVLSFSHFADAKSVSNPAASINIHKKIRALRSAAPDINPKVLRLALIAYKKARQDLDVDKKQILTVVDYQLKNSLKRLWVFNVKNNQLLFHTLVAQAKNTGFKYARHFSNRPGSRESSLGLFLTGKSYYGHLGYSLHLIGLDKGFNNNAFRRHIVMHGAWYVSERFASRYDRIGYSWGCLSLSLKVYKQVINTVKEGTLLFSYYPNQRWLSHSRFI